MAATVDLYRVPKRVYRACDGVSPEWSFMLVAANRGAEVVTLDKVTATLNASRKRVRRVRSGTRIEGIIQGEPEVASGGSLVLDIRDRTSARVSPRSVTVRLRFNSAHGKELYMSRRVLLEPRPTTYFRFPLAGRWTAINARSERHCIGGQFGFDLVAEQDLSLHQHPPEREMAIEDFSSFGQPILAPADGIIAACVDDQPDFAPIPGKVTFPEGLTEENRERYLGNYAVIHAEQNVYALLFHLMCGSLRVRQGDHVREGQQMAQVGNSGNTGGPHLHIEVLDGMPDLSQLGTTIIGQSGIPFGFRAVTYERNSSAGKLVANMVPQRLDTLSSRESD